MGSTSFEAWTSRTKAGAAIARREPSSANEIASSIGVNYPILFDPAGSTGRDYMIQKMPITFLVDRAGVVRYANVGFKRGDESAYLDEIRELLRE